MNIDEVRLLFERKGIFFFKMLQIRMGLSASDEIFSTDINYVFQAHFLFLLDKSIVEALSGEEFPGYVWLPGIINRDKKPECDVADRYMPQLLHEDTAETVPPEVKQHIAGCSVCKENLDKVHDILLEPDQIDEERAFCIHQITERLLEHFSYLDKNVDCKTVRRFLPQLADTQLAILIPTPITAHIDQCQQCRRKLSFVNRLKLTSEQLADLSTIWSGLNPTQMKEVVDEALSENVPQRMLKSIRETLYSFNDNIDSGITTIYQLGESPEKLEAAKSCKPYNLQTELNDYNAEIPEKWPGRPIDVGCNWIKYCLPLFVQRDLLVAGKIPLAALAHIEKCSQCKDDIAVLEALKLEPKQLDVLSEFYWKFRYVPEVSLLDQNESAVFHEHIETTTDLFAQMRFDQLSEETLKHICLCRKCRNMVYQKRLEMSEGAVVTGQAANIPCEAVDRASLFTYCLPFGLDPANDQYAKFRPVFISHVTNCPNCLEKLRQFHNTLYTIADREESGVIIKYEFDPDIADKKEAYDKAHLYDGFPITVKVSGETESVGFKPRAYQLFTRPIEARKLLKQIDPRKYIKPAAIARYAAAIIIVTLLSLYAGIIYTRSTTPQQYALMADADKTTILDIIKSQDITMLGYEPSRILHLDRLGDIQVQDGQLKEKKFYSKRIKMSPKIFSQVSEQLSKDGWQIYQARVPGLYADYWMNKTKIARAPAWPHEANRDIKFTQVQMLRIFFEIYKPVLFISPCIGLGVVGLCIALSFWYKRRTGHVRIIVFPHKLREKLSQVNLTKYAAAASILIVAGFFLYFSTATAMATELREIYNSVEKAKNIYIATFLPEKTKPHREMWISQELNIQVFKYPKELIVLDISDRTDSRKRMDSNSIKTTRMSDEDFAFAEKAMTDYYAIMPFSKMSAIPKKTEWEQLNDENIEIIVPDTEVYELSWTRKEKNSDLLVFEKWRGYITETNDKMKLPVRVELWRKSDENKEHKLKSVMKVAYPTPADIWTVLEEAGFSQPAVSKKKGIQPYHWIYKPALEAKNVSRAKFSARQKPIQTTLTSRSLNRHLFDNHFKKKQALWEVSDKTIKLIEPDSNAIEIRSMSDELLPKVYKHMSRPLGLIQPSSDMPENSKWNHVDNREDIPEGLEAYDLIWIQKATSGDARMFHKWRYFVNPKTHLLTKLEMYHRQIPYEKDYDLGATVMCDYPDADGVDSVIKDAGFYPHATRSKAPKQSETK